MTGDAVIRMIMMISTSDVETTPIEGYDYFVNVMLGTEDTQVSVPVLNSEYLAAAGSAASATVRRRIYISVCGSHVYADIPQMVSDSVESTCETMEEHAGILCRYYR